MIYNWGGELKNLKEDRGLNMTTSSFLDDNNWNTSLYPSVFAVH